MQDIEILMGELFRIQVKALKLLQDNPHLLLRGQYVGQRGSFGAPLLVVGEAPGEQEELNKVPFCGTGGMLMETLLREGGLEPSAVMFTNVVKFRPAKNSSCLIGPQDGNRRPTAEEIRLFGPLLFRELNCLRPRVVLAVGAAASQVLCGSKGPYPITKHRGSVVTIRVSDDYQTMVIPTFHPSYLLHRGQDEHGSDRDLVLHDIRLAFTLAFHA